MARTMLRPYVCPHYAAFAWCEAGCAKAGATERARVRWFASAVVCSPCKSNAILSACSLTHTPVHPQTHKHTLKFVPQTGVYRYREGNMVGGHAVKIVGWGEDVVGGAYWTIANSCMCLRTSTMPFTDELCG